VTSLLPFESADDIAAAEDEETDYIVEQLLIREAITSFSAKIKAGKTTFTGHMLRAIFNTESIIGLDTRPAKVLYCTEEGRKSFKAFLKRNGLTDTAGQLQVLFFGSVPKSMSWEDIANGVLGYALQVGATVVVFDTLTRWAKIKPDQENDAGAAAVVMTQLERLRNARLAVLAIFHERKSGGDVVDAGRGSSAFGGAADILLSLTNPGTNGHPNRRHLSMIGRFDDPAEWVMDLVDGHYMVQSDDGSMEIERGQMKSHIRQLLMERSLSGPDLYLALGVDKSNSTMRRALDDLTKAGEVLKMGGGKKNEPFTYIYMGMLEKIGVSQ
jgi:hypothetical protein